jgi:hypothetical protein
MVAMGVFSARKIIEDKTMPTSPNGSYSAEVGLSLQMNGVVVPLHKVGPSRVIMRTPVDLPAGHAELTVSVDGVPETSRIHLPNGASALSAAIEIEPV